MSALMPRLCVECGAWFTPRPYLAGAPETADRYCPSCVAACVADAKRAFVAHVGSLMPPNEHGDRHEWSEADAEKASRYAESGAGISTWGEECVLACFDGPRSLRIRRILRNERREWDG